jgi:hypothetical protein
MFTGAQTEVATARLPLRGALDAVAGRPDRFRETCGTYALGRAVMEARRPVLVWMPASLKDVHPSAPRRAVYLLALLSARRVREALPANA